MLNWLWKLIWPPKPDDYRVIGAADRRQQEETRAEILRKLRKRLYEK
jgi:hypothetical protein